MTTLVIIIILLVVVVLLLSLTLFFLIKKSIYLSGREKKFIVFVIDIFKTYGEDLGVQSKDEHKKLVEELEKIKNKHLKI